MRNTKISLEIGDFLGFCDMNGVEALTSDQIETLENYVRLCQETEKNGELLVVDAIYDRLMEILSQVMPDSELVTHIWEDSCENALDDTDSLFVKNPMFSIRTVKSYESKEMCEFINRLPNCKFNAHVSYKLNGHGIRVVYSGGRHIKSRSRARSSSGRDITQQLNAVLGDLNYIEGLESFDLCEIRGELVLPLKNLEEAKKYNPDLKNAFTAVASMSRDSATAEEWGLLRFVAYDFIADGMSWGTKKEVYDYLEELGFEVPMNWIAEDISADTLVAELPDMFVEWESYISDYSYYTDGIVFEVDDRQLFSGMGDNGSNYKYGNVALKMEFWKQDIYYGYVQTILWMRGKTKLSPVAIISDEEDIIQFSDGYEHMYVGDKSEIVNYEELGVITSSGNRVRRVPLYEPSNMLMLDATKGNVVHFRYGGEAGVVPCFSDGTPLVEGRIQEALQDGGSFLVEG